MQRTTWEKKKKSKSTAPGFEHSNEGDKAEDTI